ncbi:MAG: hypothetical protein LBT11_00260 [Treponema sp.]|jgi:hypothetical protein|nr:hypothetical protein [Treponema sp.]
MNRFRAHGPLLLLTALVLASCVSEPKILDRFGNVDEEFLNLDPGGSLYISVDAPALRPVLDRIPLGALNEGDAAKLLDMTSSLTAAVYPRETGRSFLALAQGRYPASQVNFAFGLSAAWKKLPSPAGFRYWRSEESALSLYLNAHYALVSDGDPFPRTGGVLAPEQYAKLRPGAAAAGWLENPSEPLNRLFAQEQIPLELAAERLLFAVQARGEDAYTLTLRLEMPSERQVRAVMAVLSMVRRFAGPADYSSGEGLQGLLGVIFANPPEAEGATLIIHSGEMTAEALALLFGQFALYSALS